MSGILGTGVVPSESSLSIIIHEALPDGNSNAAVFTTSDLDVTTINLEKSNEMFAIPVPQGSAIVNPNNCLKTDQYTLDVDDPRYKYLLSIVLRAKMRQYAVFLTISANKCSQERPRIIDITVHGMPP